MDDRVEWFELGRFTVAELTADGKWEFWDKDGFEVQWFRCPPQRRLVAKFVALLGQVLYAIDLFAVQTGSFTSHRGWVHKTQRRGAIVSIMTARIGW
jgi:hypothetical protein